MATPSKKKKTNRKILALYGVIILLLVGASLTFTGKPAKTANPVDITTITKLLQEPTSQSHVKSVEMEDFTRIIQLKFNNGKKDVSSYYVTDQGAKLIALAQKDKLAVKLVKNPAPSPSFLSILLQLLPTIIIVGILYFLIKSTMGGAKGSPLVSEVPKTRFKDIGGCDEAVQELEEITEFMRDPAKFKTLGATTPKGALLIGPPGTGKTLLARAVAGEAGVAFFQTSGSDFVEMFVGLGARRVRTIAKEARKAKKAIIFIDEIDSIGSKRNQVGSDAREHSRTLNALLTEMDGFEESNVIWIAATNDPDALDTALTRAGRFDRKVQVDLPDWKGRQAIFKIHTVGKSVAEDVDFESLGKATSGMTGADLAVVVNEALINAGRRGAEQAFQSDFMEAVSLVTLGKALKSRVLTDSDRSIISAHEAGHTIVGLALDELPDPAHVSILPRGGSGGHTKLQEPDDRFQTSAQMKARLAMFLGGMAAERIALGVSTQGPGSDLQVATQLAEQMIGKMGMGTSLSVVDDQGLLINAAVRESIHNQVEELLQNALTQATEVLAGPTWAPLFQELRATLLAKESVEREELIALKARATGAVSVAKEQPTLEGNSPAS